MHAYMSAVHGVMDLDVGCVWRSYGEIYYLTDEQEILPQVQHAILRKWLVRVSANEVKYASMDSRKVVGPRPPAPVRQQSVSALSSQRPDPSIDALRQDIAKLTGEVQAISSNQGHNADLDSIKSDIIKLNGDLVNLTSSVQTIVDLLSRGVPVSESSVKPQISISEQINEELFIPSFKVQSEVSIQTESAKVEDQSSSDALEQLKKIRKRKNSDG